MSHSKSTLIGLQSLAALPQDLAIGKFAKQGNDALLLGFTLWVGEGLLG